ncbi:MAG: ADP-glyceromanno-heptose 6-epimerase [Bacteroidota bacterium]
MILVTGAAGFIGSCLVSLCNENGLNDLLLVDDFGDETKSSNLTSKSFSMQMDREKFIGAIRQNATLDISFVFHLGARTDTTEKDRRIFDHLNLEYSKSLWQYCSKRKIPFVYASSAATYGGGELGYDEAHELTKNLKPLNPYGDSKLEFDQFVLQQQVTPPLWAGLRFFNVYGPNEYHKGRMASVIFHTFNQIRKTGSMKLFRSHREDIRDGYQSRDFIYVKDVVKVCMHFFKKQDCPSGLFNVGTGKARTFLDLARLTFKALGLEPNISFIDTPEDIRDTYQYFTEAKMDKLFDAGYEHAFFSLEEGIKEYVGKFLSDSKYY